MDNLMLRRRVLLGLLKEEYIIFADPVVEQICATNWGDGIGIRPSQAAKVTNSQFGTTFSGNTNIVSFRELIYFTSLTSFSNKVFSGCTSLTSVYIPIDITSLGQYCFDGDSALTTIEFGGPMNISGSTDVYAFRGTSNLSTVIIQDIKDWPLFTWSSSGSRHPGNNSHGIHLYVSGNNTEITSIIVQPTISSLDTWAFAYCVGLESITIPSSVSSVGTGIILGCTGLKYFEINCDVTTSNLGNGHIGDGTGVMLIKGNLTFNANANYFFDFNTIHITGNLQEDQARNYAIIRSTYTEKVIIDGNITRTVILTKGCAPSFYEIGGTYACQVLPSSPNQYRNAIIHLKYNGVAGTPANLQNAGMAKVYVDSQAILNTYLADSNWSQYSSKLDLWSNYNGSYKD